MIIFYLQNAYLSGCAHSVGRFICQFIVKMIKICKFDHLIACSDYFTQFLLHKHAFSMKRVMLRTTVACYVALNPFDA